MASIETVKEELIRLSTDQLSAIESLSGKLSEFLAHKKVKGVASFDSVSTDLSVASEICDQLVTECQEMTGKLDCEAEDIQVSNADLMEHTDKTFNQLKIAASNVDGAGYGELVKTDNGLSILGQEIQLYLADSVNKNIMLTIQLMPKAEA